MKIIEIFDGVITLREYDGYFYSVGQAIAIVILGLMSGLKNLRQIHDWATNDTVRTFPEKEPGIYYWLTVLIQIIEPESLNRCFEQWVRSIIPLEDMTIAVDGKAIRAMSKKKNPINIISAQIAEYGLTVAQTAVAYKSNEIPVVQELLSQFKIKGCLIVADVVRRKPLKSSPTKKLIIYSRSKITKRNYEKKLLITFVKNHCVKRWTQAKR